MQREKSDLIVVLDFGAQYSQLIARRVREIGVYSQILPFNCSVEEITELNPKGIIFSGGPASVSKEGSPRVDKKIFDLGLPILGICYGLQVMMKQNGGEVSCPLKKEYGLANIDIIKESVLFKKISNKSQVWMSHGDSVSALAPGFEIISSTDNCPITAVENLDKKFYGVQFHPEVVHSVEGTQLLENFVIEVCECDKTWSMTSFVDQAVEEIREKVGDKQVLCGLSGGVDSSVAAVLIHKAIGDLLVCVSVNNGLL